jgi:hypothetical protein
MIKLFKSLKEMHQLKKNKLTLEVLLLDRLYNATKLFDNIPQIIEVANKLSGTDQKDIVSALADVIHNMNQTKDGE